MWLDTIKLGFGNNLIIGFSSERLNLDRIAKKLEQEHKTNTESFGLFDSSQPNYTTYYPDVTAEDLNPKDSEFIEPVFRALSEVVVHKKWNPVDFGTKGVLKKSMSLLQGATVNPDHESSIVGNAIGAVSNVGWQNSYKEDNGIIIPAGINSALKIDGKSNPRIARGIMMKPPSIHSTSVTVNFMWDKSHPSLTDEEFFSKLGTYDKEGVMIRRMASKIIKYPEISLVHHGADPFAQMIGKDGKIINPVYADVSYNSVEAIALKKEQKLFYFDFKTDLIQNDEKNTIPAESNDNKNNSMELILAFATALGLTGTEHTKESVIAELTARSTRTIELQSSINTLTATNTTNAAEITRLKLLETQLSALLTAAPSLTVERLTSLVAFETTTLASARAKTTALYNKTKDNKPEAGIVAMIASANLEALSALDSTYQDELENKFPSKCTKCGSTSITKASAKPGETEKGSETEENKDTESVSERLRKKKIKENSLGLNDYKQNSTK